METNNNNFKVLSASVVSRLPYDIQIKYYENLVNNIDSEEEEEVVTGDVLSGADDEGDMPIQAGEFRDDASDEEVALHPVEIGHGGDSQNELESEDELEVSDLPPINDENYFIGKDGSKWKKTAPGLQRMRQQNIFRDSRFVGPNPNTKNMSIIEIFHAIMHPTIQAIICRNTNRKGRAEYEKLKGDERSSSLKKYIWEDVSEEELGTFFGILIAMGSHNASKERLEGLWQKNAFPLYRAAMSAKRFKIILRFIRFDQQNTREQRSLTDKAAPISEIFEMLNANLRQNYRPSQNITVDEQLFPFRGRTKFTQYIPSKPAKYGIKLWWVCDAKSYYPLTGQIYTGKSGSDKEKNQGERVVKDLVEQYKNTGRNVTCDNFFTSLSLADTLASWKLSMVGTLKKNKTCIPSEFKPSPQRIEHSSIFGFAENRSICSYVPKKNKTVVLLSTMPYDDTISDTKQKPNIILFYNMTKGGVDVMDHMLGQYTTKRKTNRWPLALFFNMLDISALASYIIYTENFPSHFTTKNGNLVFNICSKETFLFLLLSKTGGRRLFLQQLAEQLCMPTILKRAKIPRVVAYFPTKSAIECITGVLVVALNNSTLEAFFPDDDDRGHSRVKGGCYMCYKDNCKRKRSTRKVCGKCHKPICVEHSKVQTKCMECLNH